VHFLLGCTWTPLKKTRAVKANGTYNILLHSTSVSGHWMACFATQRGTSNLIKSSEFNAIRNLTLAFSYSLSLSLSFSSFVQLPFTYEQQGYILDSPKKIFDENSFARASRVGWYLQIKVQTISTRKSHKSFLWSKKGIPCLVFLKMPVHTWNVKKKRSLIISN